MICGDFLCFVSIPEFYFEYSIFEHATFESVKKSGNNWTKIGNQNISGYNSADEMLRAVKRN